MLEKIKTFVSKMSKVEWVAVALAALAAVAGLVGCVVACSCGCRKRRRKKVGAPLAHAPVATRGEYYVNVNNRLKI